uniref:Uncharacterized protein n=1 Tax=Physcomitrium patens TaxID=3218 RepID=A0A2K1KQ76_PHYPA|nr:hypothetical protein PHYPA_006824 [Physcomitrium patens]
MKVAPLTDSSSGSGALGLGSCPVIIRIRLHLPLARRASSPSPYCVSLGSGVSRCCWLRLRVHASSVSFRFLLRIAHGDPYEQLASFFQQFVTAASQRVFQGNGTISQDSKVTWDRPAGRKPTTPLLRPFATPEQSHSWSARAMPDPLSMCAPISTFCDFYVKLHDIRHHGDASERILPDMFFVRLKP